MIYNSSYPININYRNPAQQQQAVHSALDENKKNQNPQATLQEERPVSQNNRDTVSFTQKPPQEKQEKQGDKSPQGIQDVDYSSKKINIKQVLVDFNNTIKAIGTTPEVNEQVQGYLNLVEAQSKKTLPNKQLIKLNLKNASTLLDNFISSALDKESKVVEGWVDALFLQNIDYKYNENEKVIPLINIDEKTNEVTPNKEALIPPNSVEEVKAAPLAQVEDDFQIPQVEEALPDYKVIRDSYIKAQEFTKAGDLKNALSFYEKTLSHAQEHHDKKTQAKVFFEVGKLLNENNFVPDALNNFYASSVLHYENQNQQGVASACYEIGKIYDEKGMIDPAMDFYFTTLAYNGQVEDLSSQVGTLKNMGDMHAKVFLNQDALDYLKLSLDFAKEVQDASQMGGILNSTAGIFDNSGEPSSALKYYKQAAKCSKQAKDLNETFTSYIQAGDLMTKLGYSNKAKSLYDKAFATAQELGDKVLVKHVKYRMAES